MKQYFIVAVWDFEFGALDGGYVWIHCFYVLVVWKISGGLLRRLGGKFVHTMGIGFDCGIEWGGTHVGVHSKFVLVALCNIGGVVRG